MLELIGHLHPLLVHLPIGILLLAILFELLPSRKRYRPLKRSIFTILLIGSTTAVMSCVTGYVLSQSGDYESELIGWHQWMGISLTIYSLGYSWIRNKKGFKPYRKLFSFVLLILLMITGHLGGSITHGEDYLMAAVSVKSSFNLSNVNLQEALYYEDLVKPILQNRCAGCHGSSKQKGKLRLDAPEYILKGGKDGKVLIAGKVDDSEMIDRLLLPPDDEDHMPPKEKAQPSAKEIEILKLWIASGADFKKSVVESNQVVSLQKVMSSKEIKLITDVPEEDVASADSKTINELLKLGAVILPVAQGSNYLSVNLINVEALDSAVDQLSQLNQQLVWLKAGGQPMTDNHLLKLVHLNNITKLSLEHTRISDVGLSSLKSLKNLQYLNLNGTQVTFRGLVQLEGLPQLKNIFVYQTLINREDIGALNKSFPNAIIDFGDYVVPALPFDTIVSRAPVSK